MALHLTPKLEKTTTCVFFESFASYLNRYLSKASFATSFSFVAVKWFWHFHFQKLTRKGFQAELSSKYYSLHLFLQFYFCLILKHDPEKLFTFFLLNVLLLVVVYFHLLLYRIFALKQIFQMHAILIIYSWLKIPLLFFFFLHNYLS